MTPDQLLPGETALAQSVEDALAKGLTDIKKTQPPRPSTADELVTKQLRGLDDQLARLREILKKKRELFEQISDQIRDLIIQQGQVRDDSSQFELMISATDISAQTIRENT